ncbi:MAG: hypothetical protein ABI317_00015, partial [Gaiellales bacterium]
AVEDAATAADGEPGAATPLAKAADGAPSRSKRRRRRRRKRRDAEAQPPGEAGPVDDEADTRLAAG